METSHSRLTLWATLIFAAFAFSGGATAQSGALRLSLEAEGPDGASYRLRDALFLVKGTDTTLALTTDEDLGAVVLSVELPAGAYSIELTTGWRLERTANAESTEISAQLSSGEAQEFVINPAATTKVVYTFEVNNLEPGQLQLGLAVQFSLCDPVAQTGCMAAEKCTAVGTGEGQFQTNCVADGVVHRAQTCSLVEEGADDCVAGLICYGGTCERVCNSEDDIPGCFCLSIGGIFEDRSGIGVCQASCDPLNQDCPAGEACYLNVLSQRPLCAPPVPGAGRQGDGCQYLNDCEAGYGCAVDNPVTPSSLECTFVCDAFGGSPSCAEGPGVAFTCVRVKEFYGDLPEFDDRIGLCIDCSQFPTVPACSG